MFNNKYFVNILDYILHRYKLTFWCIIKSHYNVNIIKQL